MKLNEDGSFEWGKNGNQQNILELKPKSKNDLLNFIGLHNVNSVPIGIQFGIQSQTQAIDAGIRSIQLQMIQSIETMENPYLNYPNIFQYQVQNYKPYFYPGGCGCNNIQT